MAKIDKEYYKMVSRLFLIIFIIFNLLATLVAADNPVEIVKVWPEKLLYLPEETANILITLRNNTNENQVVQLESLVVCEIDTIYNLLKEDVNIPPESEKEIQLKWDPKQIEYGVEVRAQVSQNGKVIDTKSEVFAICDNARKISQGYVVGGGKKEYYRDTLIPILRENYIMVLESFGAGPDDFMDLSPENEDFYSGQAGIPNSKSDIRALVEEAHKNGIKVVVYANTCVGSIPGAELLRQHPEWAMYSWFGQFDGLWNCEEFDNPEDSGNIYIYQGLDPYDIEVVKKLTSELIESTKMYGWDGVRFDGHPFVSGTSSYRQDSIYNYKGERYPINEIDDINVRNIKFLKTEIRKIFPKFLFGYNPGLRYEEGPGDSPKGYAELSSGGGWLLWESSVCFFSKSHPLYSTFDEWEEWRRLLKEEVENTRKYGGYQGMNWTADSFSGKTPSSIFRRHIFSLAFASGATFYCYPYNAVKNWSRFITRYSGIIYDDKRQRVDKPEEMIEIDDATGIWWKEYVYSRKRGEKEYLIVHLVNPPVEKVIKADILEVPGVKKDIGITLKIPEGRQIKKAWLLSPEYEKTCQSLQWVMKDKKQAHLVIPELKFWDIVVIEL